MIRVSIVILLCSAFFAAKAEEAASKPKVFSSDNFKTGDWYVVTRDENTNFWLDPHPYDMNSATAILAAIDKSNEWDGHSHAAAYGLIHAHSPGITISLTSAAKTEQIQSGVNMIAICYGNHQFWFGDALYQLNDAGFAALKAAFPNNCFDNEK